MRVRLSRPLPPLSEVDRISRIRWLAERAAEDARSPLVRQLARALGRSATRRELARCALVAVQRHTRFVRDPDEARRGDTFKRAARLLRDGVGDCDDSAPFLAALYTVLGFHARLVGWSVSAPFPEHVGVQVLVDGRWLDAEPTIPGALLGESPYAAADRLRTKRSDLGR